VAHEWSRFTYWLAQGQNAPAIQAVTAILLALVAAWYTYLTYWIMKATGKQASAALQPILSLRPFASSPDQPVRTLLIENPTDRPIVFLDVVIVCSPMGQRRIIHKLRAWDDEILSARDSIKLPLDFTKELAVIQVSDEMCGFVARLVVSDLSRYVVIQYEYVWVLGRLTGRAGLPWGVRLRYAIRPLKWRYHRVKHWLSTR
jgi:hypothetical protein